MIRNINQVSYNLVVIFTLIEVMVDVAKRELVHEFSLYMLFEIVILSVAHQEDGDDQQARILTFLLYSQPVQTVSQELILLNVQRH